MKKLKLRSAPYCFIVRFIVQGWIAIHRKIMNHWIWQKRRKFSKFEAWLHLLMCANHTEKKVLFNNRLIKVRRGERVTSEVKLAEEWRWDRKTVRSFLDLLSDEKMIQVKRTTQYTSYYIEKYNTYQKGGTGKGTTIGHQKNTNNNDKNDLKEKKEVEEKKTAADIPNSIEEFNSYFIEQVEMKYKKVGYKYPLGESRILIDAGDCYNYFNKSKWHDSKGKIVLDWKGRVRTWITKTMKRSHPYRDWDQKQSNQTDHYEEGLKEMGHIK